jgi:preprotein translocase subunit SecG
VIAYVLYTLFAIACFILILVVLLQPGKGDAASAFGGGVSGAAFGPRGTTTLLAKITIGAAIAFMGLAFVLSVPGFITGRSVTSGYESPETGDTPAPAEGTTAPEGTPIPAGQIQVTPEGQVAPVPEAPAEGAAPAAPATAPETKSEAKDDAKKGEAKDDAKKPADTKKP